MPKINEVALARAIARAKGLKRHEPFLAKIKANKKIQVKTRGWLTYVGAALANELVARFYKQEIGR